MPKKLKFNKKLMNRFNKKELFEIIKKHNLPLEKAKSHYSKAEIVFHLIRLQRVTQYSGVFDKLEIKAPRQLTQRQKDSLARSQFRMKEETLKLKQQVSQESKIDVKPISTEQVEEAFEPTFEEVSITQFEQSAPLIPEEEEPSEVVWEKKNGKKNRRPKGRSPTKTLQ